MPLSSSTNVISWLLLLVVRYEDVAVTPMAELVSLCSFLNISVPPESKLFVEEHTAADWDTRWSVWSLVNNQRHSRFFQTKPCLRLMRFSSFHERNLTEKCERASLNKYRVQFIDKKVYVVNKLLKKFKTSPSDCCYALLLNVMKNIYLPVSLCIFSGTSTENSIKDIFQVLARQKELESDLEEVRLLTNKKY